MNTCNYLSNCYNEILKINAPAVKLIDENFNYPETAKRDSIEGEVIVEFWIDTNGITSEYKIVRSVRKDLDEEALRIAKLIKFDKPAMNRGKPVGFCFRLPISFELSANKKQRSLPVKKK